MDDLYSKSPLPEWPDHSGLMETLEGLGWENGEAYGMKEHELLRSLILTVIFDTQFKELNSNLLNDLTPSQQEEILGQVKSSLENADEETLLNFLKYGISLTVKREKRTFILIDFENIHRNKFIYAHELKFPGSPENVKPDFTLFVNGIPLVAIEVEPSTKLNSSDEGLDQMRRYEQQAPDLFRFVQLGVIYADRNLFIPTFPNWNKEPRKAPGQPWKVEELHNGKIIKIENIHELLRPATLLEILRWFTFFRDRSRVKEKIIARYNQFYATEKVLKRVRDYLNGGDRKNGLVWHWQGSGKTYTMFFIANKFFEEFFSEHPLVFFVVDRRDLQRQLLSFLEGLKVRKFKDFIKVIENIRELREVITTIKRSEYRGGIIAKGIYIVLIQKFRKEDFEDLLEDLGREYLEYLHKENPDEYERISRDLAELSTNQRKIQLIELGGIRKKEVMLLIDEAHRSQYGLLASVMKNVFPNAMRFAFTGTPVFKFERNTFEEFAYPPREYYLDVYFIRDSISDGFTLPISYDVVQEGDPLFEGVKILLEDEDVKRFIDEWIETSEEGGGSSADDLEAIMEGEQLPETIFVTRRDISRHLNKVKVFLTNERRLEKLAQYIARRLEEDTEGFRFKAMVVAANRKACVLLKKYLDEAIANLYGPEYGEEVSKWVEVVMTYQQNDKDEILAYKENLIQRRGKKDLNEINSDIQIEFKEKDNPKVLVVTDMLITGFDAPKLKVMYLDKPLYEHRLLQAIARVNRPYEDEVTKKEMGLVVDSVGLLRYVRESIRRFQLIAEGEIVSDLEENLLEQVEARFEEFKGRLNSLKEHLKDLKVEGRDLSINVDELVHLSKSDKVAALQLIKELDGKLKIMAVFWDKVEVHRVLGEMKETLQLYKALGSHKGKMHYADEVKVIAYLYGKLIHYIRGRKPPKEFWEGLIELIHEKTLVEDFKEVISTRITNEDLEHVLERIKELRASEIVPDRVVADAYGMIKTLLEDLPRNPVYKEIKERVERARIEWMARNIDTASFLELLAKSVEEKLSYDERISSMGLEDRIVETVETILRQRLGLSEEVTFTLNNFKKTLSEIVRSSRIVSLHEKIVRTALMKDLFKEISGKVDGITTSDIKKLCDEIKDYVVQTLRESKEVE